MKKCTTEYNKRQYSLILQLIKLYKEKNINILDLINKIESLINVLEELEWEEKLEFLYYTGKIDEIYSSSYVVGKGYFDKDDFEKINVLLIGLLEEFKKYNF